MSTDPTCIVCASVDWITATANESPRGESLVALGKALLGQAIRTGDLERSFDWRGYYLRRAGSVAIGVRADGVMLQISGDQAGSYFASVLESSNHLARLDLQVTVKTPRYDSCVAGDAYLRAVDGKAKNGHPPTFTFMENSGGGSTLYVGSRKSEMYGRLYDKQAESHERRYANCWRYEVELKNDHATDLGQRLAHSRDAYGTIVSYVHRWYTDRGVAPLFSSDTLYVPVPQPARRTDSERKLAWLRSQVSPTVSELIAAGHYAKVLEALSLDSDRLMHPDPRDYASNGHHGGDLEGFTE